MSALNWEDIDDHLFHRYDVEGKDDELSNLYKEHDKAVAEYVLGEFLKQFEKDYDPEKNILDNEKKYAVEVAEMVATNFNEKYDPSIYYDDIETEVER